MTGEPRKQINIVFNVDLFGNITKITSENTESIKLSPKIDTSRVKVANFDCRSCRFGQYQMNFYFKFPLSLHKTENKTIRVKYCTKIGTRKPKLKQMADLKQDEILYEAEEALEMDQDDGEMQTHEEEFIEQDEEIPVQQDEIKPEPVPVVVQTKPIIKLRKLSKSAIEKLKLHRLNSPAIYSNPPSLTKMAGDSTSSPTQPVLAATTSTQEKEEIDENMEEVLDEDSGNFVHRKLTKRSRPKVNPNAVVTPYTEEQKEDFMRRLNILDKLKPKNDSPQKIKIDLKTLMKKATVIQPPVEPERVPPDEDDGIQVFTQCEDDTEAVERSPSPVEPFNVYFDYEKEEKSRPWWDRIKEVPKISHATNGICNYCDFEFGSKPKWYHLRKHGIFPYLCEFCGRGEIKIGQLEQHIDCTRPDFKQIFFPKKPPIKRDTRKKAKPTSTVRRVCNFCGIMFHSSSKSAMINHMALEHAIGQLYQCQECPYASAKLESFDAHMLRRHSPNEMLPIKCDKCDKRVATKTDLKVHSISHTNVKPNVCELCGKSYKHKCDLTNHMHAHTGARPYECRFCDKKFQDRGNKNAHQRRVHAEAWELWKSLTPAEKRNESLRESNDE